MSARDRLLAALTANYTAALDPGKTELTIGVLPIFIDHDKSAKQLTIAVFEFHSWKDSRLTWNPKDYDGVKSLRIPSKLVWIPDTRLYNTVPAVMDRDGDVNAVVTSDGTVLWVPRSNYQIHCKETGNGQLSGVIKVGSWTYPSNEIALKLYKPDGLDLSYYDSTCSYSIVSHSAKIVDMICENEAYPVVEISFTVKHCAEA